MLVVANVQCASFVTGMHRELEMSQCNVWGSLPASFSTLVGLTSLSISRNQLLGSIPDTWTSLGQLVFFDASHQIGKKLCGSLPSLLGAMSSLG